MSIEFSIVIPSRDRPVQFRTAIESVLRQEYSDKEVIVVDDGSSGENAMVYRKMEEEFSGRVRFFHLIYRPHGHGSAYSRNFGVDQAVGKYICFLDDDDCWIDDGHLRRAHQIITTHDSDVYFSNQEAFLDGKKVEHAIWIEDMPAIERRNLKPDAFGAYRLTSEALLLCTGFAHLNTTIIRRDVFAAIGGFDETIRYEVDRDIYLRLLDQVTIFSYSPSVTARHHVPDPNEKSSVSTSLPDLQKRLAQLRDMNNLSIFARSEAVCRYCRIHKNYSLKRIAQGLAEKGKYDSASHYAREALLIGFSLKWLLFTILVTLRHALSRRNRGNKGLK